MAERVTAKDLLEHLRNFYIAPSRPEPGYFCPELPDPTDKRRADLIWVPTTWQERGQLIGHEIKVSRADVVAELADPTKADAWARYCDRWWLVIPDAALIDGLNIPEHWGVMTPPSGRKRRAMTVVKDAPPLNPADKALALANVINRLHNAGDDVHARIRQLEEQVVVANRRAEVADTELTRVNELLRGTEAGNRWELERVNAILDAIREVSRSRDRSQWSPHEPLVIAAAALDYGLVRQRTQMLLHRVDDRIRTFDRALAPTNVDDITKGLTGLSRRLQKDLDESVDPRPHDIG